MTSPPVIGRAGDRASVESFLQAFPVGAAGLVVAGEAGIGKTTLWHATVEEAQHRGYRVLMACPAESEARLSYIGLGDLLDAVADEELLALPQSQRRALDVALLRGDGDGTPPDQRSVSVAVLGALRLLCAKRPVLVAVDDVQWLDHPSARILHFAVRRLGPASVGVMVALRVAPGLIDPLDLTQGIAVGRLWRVEVSPLSLAALRRVITARLGAGMSQSMLSRVHRTSGGNPFFALELARALWGRDAELVSGQPLPVPEDLGALVAARLSHLADDVRQVVQIVAALSQPTGFLVDAVLGAGIRSGVDAAAEAGVIRIDGGRLRLAHPLLGSVAYYQCTVAERLDLHRRIAGAVSDPEEKGRHLALSTSGPDVEVAAALDVAARVAAGRGAPDAAAEMCELARRLTPGGDQDGARQRSLRAARHHFAAGESRRAGAQLEEIIAATSPGPARAQALRMLGELRFNHDFADAVRLFERARADAGDDDRLRASIEVDLAFAVVTASGDTVTSAAYANSAVTHGERLGEPALLAAAYAVAGLVDFLSGRPGADRRMALAVELDDLDRPNVLFGRPSFLAGFVWMLTERHHDASALFERLHRLAIDQGTESAIPLQGLFATWLACWMGDLDGARRYATTSVEAAEHVGGDVSLAAALTAQVLVSAHAGDLDATRQYAPEATRLFQRSGWIIPSLWSIWALGFVELSIGDAGAAHHLLGPVSQIMMAAGVVEATPAPSIPDDIEAMIALGELDEAEVLLGWLEALGRRQDRAWALATSGRCRALMLAVRGDLDGAAAVLKGALVQHDRIPLPLDRGRTLLILGQVERRRKHKAAAKHAFEQSLAIFDAVGATLWEKRAREELSRVGIRPAAPLELTATEAKVAELAAQGLSSKQVADQAFMSPRSVEGVLARIYRKLGVNSRAELANAVAARRSTPTNLT